MSRKLLSKSEKKVKNTAGNKLGRQETCQADSSPTLEQLMDHEVLKDKIAEQFAGLRQEIKEINEKFTNSSILLEKKEGENRELKEKLMDLEVTVQHLFDASRSSRSGCCSSQCRVF